MSTFVLLHGAGSDSWYWHRVVPLLEALGHEVLTPNLPVYDDQAGLAAYTDKVVRTIGDRTGVVLVAQSLSGLVAPLVADRVPVDLLVLVAAMVPKPGEVIEDWWTATRHDDARVAADRAEGRNPLAPFDPLVTFLHDVPADVIAESAAHAQPQSERVFQDTWPLSAWPDVPTRFLLCRQDRFFPAELQRRVVQDRLGFAPDEMDSGHLPALSQPEELVRRLDAYRAEVLPQP